MWKLHSHKFPLIFIISSCFFSFFFFFFFLPEMGSLQNELKMFLSSPNCDNYQSKLSSWKLVYLRDNGVNCKVETNSGWVINVWSVVGIVQVGGHWWGGFEWTCGGWPRRGCENGWNVGDLSYSFPLTHSCFCFKNLLKWPFLHLIATGSLNGCSEH